MATVKMTGIVDLGEMQGTKKVVADINASEECIKNALKDGFKFLDPKDAEKYSTLGLCVEK